MKKIGILTFHWATNYGAVLQSYALQTYLVNQGYEVYIINYKPKQFDKSFLKCFVSRSYHSFRSKVNELNKEKRLIKFRENYLNVTDKRYYTLDELQSNPPILDVYITGSDQVWNQYFINSGEKGNSFNTVYFLNFGGDDIKRFSYAASFGCLSYPVALQTKLKKHIDNLDFISVREESGVGIINSMKRFDAEVVCDPTLLLEAECYAKIVSPEQELVDYYIYLLRNEIEKIDIKNLAEHDSSVKISSSEPLESWLSYIKYSKNIVTNSFHGVVFSILFEKQFVVVLDENNSMNDRFVTLLGKVGLLDRIIYTYENKDIRRILKDTINWSVINSLLEEFRKQSFSGILKSLKQ